MNDCDLRPPSTPRDHRGRLSFVARRVLRAAALSILVGGLLVLPPAHAIGPPDWLGNPNDDPSFGDATPGERFGESLVLDGGRLAVGTWQSYDDAGEPTGSVRVFERTAAGWSATTRVDPPTPQAWALFGVGLALDGATLAVGAPNFDQNGQFDAGVVSVHAFNGVTFVAQQILTAAPAADLRYFGAELALDADTLVVAARQGDSGPVRDAGVVQIYRNVAGTWQLRQTLGAMVPRSYDGFGTALHLDGDVLLVGAPGETPRGNAYAFVREQDVWVLRQRFEAPPASNADDFGAALVADGERVLIGAPAYLQGPGGAVFEWRREGSGWVAGRTLSMPGQTDLQHFGIRLAHHGNRWLVGAVRGANSGAPSRIELFGYLEAGNELTLERQISVSYQHGGGHSLRDIAVDAQSALIGLPSSLVAPWSDAGEVRVVPLQSGTTQVSLSTGATAADENFGDAVAASSQWLAVGAPYERRQTARRGGVYVFPRVGADAQDTTRIPLTVPELAPRDQFGSALAFSANTLLVGAPFRQGGGSVFAFEHDGTAWQPVASWRPSATSFNRFGDRIDADAQAFAASAPWETGGGAVYVVERSGGGWAPPFRLESGDTQPAGSFGIDIDLQGNMLAVSAQRIELGGFGQPVTVDGAAYVFARTAIGWSRLARVERPVSPISNAEFGAAVAVDGDVLAVGAPLGGEVHLYRRNGGVWSWTHRIDGPQASYSGFGNRLRFADGDLWIAAPVANALFRYRTVGDTWRLVQRIAVFDGGPYDGFGSDFVIDAGRVFAGVPARRGHHPRVRSAGAVRVDEPALFADAFEP